MHYKEAPVMLVTFDSYFDGEFWCARGMGVDIFTQGTTLDELMHNVKDAVELHFEETIDAGEQITVVSLTELQVGSIARISGC
jgi:predicted RNase H-like HicB family nuclease